MTVYVWRSWYEKPRVQHLATPHEPDDPTALCGATVWPAEAHDRIRRTYTPSRSRHRLTSIDYDRLPMRRPCRGRALAERSRA